MRGIKYALSKTLIVLLTTAFTNLVAFAWHSFFLLEQVGPRYHCLRVLMFHHHAHDYEYQDLRGMTWL